MQKVIGGILILSATAGAGVVYGNELKRYLRNMVYLRYVFGLIRGEIEYTCAPLPEIFFYFRFEFPHNNMMYHFSTSFLIFSCFLCILYFFVLHCLQRFLESYCKQDRRKRHSQQICRRFCKVNSHRFI